MLPTQVSSQLAFRFRRRKEKWRLSWISDQNDFTYFCFTSLRCFLPSFDSIVSVQEKKGKLDFQDGRQVLSQLAFWFRRRSKYRFSRWLPWRPSWISDRNDLAIFDLQVTPMPPTKFRVNWPFGSGEEAKNRFSRWPPWWPSWFPIGTIFTFFINKSPPRFLPSFESVGLLVQEKKRKIEFQPWWSSWISDRIDFSILIYKSPRCFLLRRVIWPFGSGEEAKIFKMAAILDFRSERF